MLRYTSEPTHSDWESLDSYRSIRSNVGANKKKKLLLSNEHLLRCTLVTGKTDTTRTYTHLHARGVLLTMIEWKIIILS